MPDLDPVISTIRDDVVLRRLDDSTPFAITAYGVLHLGAFAGRFTAYPDNGDTVVNYIHNPDAAYDEQVVGTALAAFSRFVLDHCQELGYPNHLVTPLSVEQVSELVTAYESSGPSIPHWVPLSFLQS